VEDNGNDGPDDEVDEDEEGDDANCCRGHEADLRWETGGDAEEPLWPSEREWGHFGDIERREKIREREKKEKN